MILGVLALATALTAAPAARAQQPKPLVRVAFPQEDGSLTPYTFQVGYSLMTLVYDTLMWRDARGVPRPWLASSVRRDATGRKITVKLRAGARWHDGRPLTAQDVVFTYRYVARKRHPRFTPQVRDIRSVSATDDRTVVFALRRASLGFADQPLADVPILPRHLWQGLPEGRRTPVGLAVGSGPYRLVQHDIGRGYRFEADRTYFRGAPAVARIDVPIIDRQDRSVDALRTRRIDAAPVSLPPGAPGFRIPGVTLSPGRSYTGTALVFNVERPPFAALRARRAVSLALDLDDIAGQRTGPGRPVPAGRGVLHPGSGWADAGILHRFDRQAAQVAFAEQGIGVVRILAPDNDALRIQAGRRVVQALGRAGARATLATLPAPDFDRALGRRGNAAAFDVAVVASPALSSHDPAFLRAVYGDPRSAPLNDGAYRSEPFERAADRVASATSPPSRRRAVASELRLLARELPAIPLFFGGGTFAFRPAAYDGWVAVAGSGILNKLSFVSAPRKPGAARLPAATDPVDTSTQDDGVPSLLPVVLLLAVGLAGAAAWRLRSRSRRR